MNASIPNRLNWEKKQLYERCWHFATCFRWLLSVSLSKTRHICEPVLLTIEDRTMCAHVYPTNMIKKRCIHSELSHTYFFFLSMTFGVIFTFSPDCSFSLFFLFLPPSSGSKGKWIRLTLGHDKHLWESKNFLFIYAEPGPVIIQNISFFLNLIWRLCYHS